MKKFLLIGVALLALSGCAAGFTLTPTEKKIVTVLCNVDAVAQPVAIAIADAVAPEVAALATLDQQLVHPAVVAACAAINGVPSVVVTGTVAPPAPPAPVAS